MRRKNAVLAVVAAVSCIALVTTPSWATDDLSLNVTPATECVSTGQTITVYLDVANLSAAINGVQVRLNYDDTLMTLVDVVPTDLGLTEPASGWPRVLQFPTRDEIEAQTGLHLVEGVMLLDDEAADGYARGWRPVEFGPERHLGYAVQWFALALTLVIIWIVVNWRKRGS